MATRPRRLSATFTRTVTEPGRFGDGHGGYGLTLLVKTGKHGRVLKSWAQRVRIDGRETNIGLGAYPIVTLAEARKQALANRRLIAQGRHPKTGDTDRMPTFREAVERVIRIRRATWKAGGRSEDQWRRGFEAYIYPRFGDKRVGGVTVADVMRAMTADDFWNKRRATARRLLQWVSVVMRYSVAEGYRDDDPVPAIRQALPSDGVRVKHQRALPHGEVAGALARVRLAASREPTKLCFLFMCLTATRSAEARNARWSHIRGDVWTIPETGTKAGREHRVPLSSAALAVLAEARHHSTGDLVFPGVRGGVIGGKTLSDLPKAAGVKAVPHGFRTSARSWMADEGVPREVAEACLGHVVANQAEAAYRHGTDLLERRREVMQAWGEYAAKD